MKWLGLTMILLVALIGGVRLYDLGRNRAHVETTAMILGATARGEVLDCLLIKDLDKR